MNRSSVPAEAPSDRVRLAELGAALSLGIDLGFGQPMEHVLRQCLIAERLVVSPKTAGNHIELIYSKINAKNRVAASLFAVEHGLLPEE